ncbi:MULTISPECIES: response regulator [Thermus]|uniref:response regulator n=1 Tax=Thermus TaxID=270 RepID=UPI001F40A1CB|nr:MULTISPECIES: response regulator [Thermus]
MDRALIVEDDPRVASLHRAFLEAEGVQVVGVAGSLEGALSALALEPDLVLLDLYLPDGHGLDLLPALVGTYVIVITAAKDVPTVERALLGGAMDYLVKPFGQSRLKEALSRYRAFRALKKKDEVSQADLDRLLARRRTPKGLDPLTLERVLALFQGRETLTVEEVALALGLSRVTAWRYLEGMRREGLLEGEVDPRGQGRPLRRYRLAGG